MLAESELRLKWIKFYQKVGHAGKVCQHYGISRFTFRKWLKRYQEFGEEGLVNLSRKPKSSPFQKLNNAYEQLILSLRKERNLGARRLQSELKRLHCLSFSLSTIHKVLKKYEISPLQHKRHYRKKVKRYNCKVPGERIQMDVCKITHGLYQYTAIDDCTRYKVLALYTRRTAANTLDFLIQVKERMPFPCQRIQTDRGKEFFAYEVQERLKEWKIKFRPIKPYSPHLNGKVERTQRTDLDEFYNSIDLKEPQLSKKLRDWEGYYNRHRPHSSLHGKTPWEMYKKQEKTIPCLQEIHTTYDHSEEAFAIQNYQHDQALKLLKRQRNMEFQKNSSTWDDIKS